MGTLSQNYTPVTQFTKPGGLSKNPDIIKSDAGNPHWHKEATELKTANVEEVYMAASAYIEEVTKTLEKAYSKLNDVSQVEPLIKFDGSSELIDTRLDELIPLLTQINTEIIEYIETATQNTKNTAENYMTNYTENCCWEEDIFEYSKDEKGQTVSKKVGEYHQCGTHGKRAYMNGTTCEYCG